MPDYVNTVPGGQIGTGNAQVFGVNPLASQFAGQLQNLRREEALQAQKLAAQMKENQLAVSGGKLFEDQVSKMEQDHIQKGIDLQKQGINPYGSSADAMAYGKERRLVQAKQKYREALEKQAVATDKYIQENLDSLEPADIKRYHDAIANTSLEEAFSGNFAFPEIRKRFRDDEVLKTIKPLTTKTDVIRDGVKVVDDVLDKKGTEDAIIGGYLSNPRGQEQIAKATNGFPVADVQTFGTTYADNLKEVREDVKGDPRLREALAGQGIVIGTPAAEEFISDQAKMRTDARKGFDAWLEPKLDLVKGGLKTSHAETPVKNDLSDENLEERIRHNKAMEAKKKASGADAGAPAPPQDLQFSFGETKDGKRSTFTGKGTVALNTPPLNMHGMQVIDTATGKLTKIADSSNDFALAELTHVPVLTKDVTIRKSDGSTEKLKAGAIVQDNFAEKNGSVVTYKKMGVVQKPRPNGKFSTYYVDAEVIPTNTFSKKTQAEYDRFKATPTPQTSKPTQSSGKTATTAQIKELVGKKGFEGYTEKELIDYYKSQGYTVK